MPGRNTFGFAAVILWCLLGFAPLAPVAAQAGTSAVIHVVPGAPGALITGAVLRGERDVYRLAAKAGLRLHVEIVSVEQNAVFQLYLPGKGNKTLPGAGEADDATLWNGTLPKSGVYRIVVGGTRGNAEYTVRVDLAE